MIPKFLFLLLLDWGPLAGVRLLPGLPDCDLLACCLLASCCLPASCCLLASCCLSASCCLLAFGCFVVSCQPVAVRLLAVPILGVPGRLVLLVRSGTVRLLLSLSSMLHLLLDLIIAKALTHVIIYFDILLIFRGICVSSFFWFSSVLTPWKSNSIISPSSSSI